MLYLEDLLRIIITVPITDILIVFSLVIVIVLGVSFAVGIKVWKKNTKQNKIKQNKTK